MIPPFAAWIWPEVRHAHPVQRRTLYRIARETDPKPAGVFLLLIAAAQCIVAIGATQPSTSFVGALALRLIAPVTLINLVLIVTVLIRPPFGRRGVWHGLNQLGITTCEGCGQDCRGCRGITCPECGGRITHPMEPEDSSLDHAPD